MKDRCQVLIVGVLALTALQEVRSGTLAETTTPSPKKESKSYSTQWRGKMQELYKTLVEIITDASSDRRFNDPENRSRIEKNTKKLADRAHELSAKELSPDADPTIKILSGLFQDETQRAYWALKSGNRSYARGVLNHISSYCIACHTRNNSGPSFSHLPLEPFSKGLYLIEQGRFYTATRQYDRALAVFQKIMDDASAPMNRPLEWEQSVRYGLTIAVRVKKDPDQARSLVERVIGSKNAPFFLKQDALKWKDSIIKWKKEIPRRALTEEGLHAEAMRLVAEAHELQKYPMDHGADVLYLRATAVVHELLQMYPNGMHSQEALLMAGMCYDVLMSLNLDDMHEMYYEACIKRAPHTPTAEVCFRRYQQSTYEGYTGSAGTFLPEHVIQKLQQLEKLAHPKDFSEPQLK